MKHHSKISAQTFIEYTLLLGIVTMIIFAMAPIVRRTSQGMVKIVADQIGNQASSEQAGASSGYISEAQVRSVSDKTQRTTALPGGILQYEYEESVQSFTEQVTNQGRFE